MVRGFAECRYVRQKEVRKGRKEMSEERWRKTLYKRDEKDRTIGGERIGVYIIRERARQ